MATNAHTTTRRTALAALAGAPLATFAIPALAHSAGTAPEADEGQEARGDDARFSEGYEIAMLHMARAWVNRWRACGGNFALAYNPDGSIRDLLFGMAEPSFWTPTDEGNYRLQPHEWLTERERQRGAVKILNSLLTLVPGLTEKVAEISGYAELTRSQREG